MRLKKILANLTACLIFLLGFAGLCFGEDLTVTVMDVGQADAILIQTAGKNVLIDAGEQKSHVYEMLQKRGVNDLDLAVATHAHADHIGGMKDVLENQKVKVYMDNGYPHTSATYTHLMETAESKVKAGELRYIVGRAGQRLNLGKEAHFEVVWPDKEGLHGTRSDLNANSIVMKLVHGDVCIALMGDAEAETEEKVANLIGKCQLLKVSHHGSKHSSIPMFLDALKPEAGFISCGLANKHGHPGQEVLRAFEARNIIPYRTDLMGDLKIVSNGKTYKVTTEREPLKITKVNINLADKKALKELPGVGDKTAEAIISYREANGAYKTIEDVYKCAPKMKKRLEKIMPFITVNGGSATGLTEPANTAAPAAPAVPAAPAAAAPAAAAPAVPAAPAAAAPAAPAAAGGKVNINTAGQAELENMPGMTAGRAKAAIEYRTKNGPFKSCEQLDDVKGIGPKTVEKIMPVCTVN